MRAAAPVKADALPSVCQRKVVTTNPTGAKTECVFADGTSILVSNFLASFLRAGDDFTLFSGASGCRLEHGDLHPQRKSRRQKARSFSNAHWVRVSATKRQAQQPLHPR